MKILFTTHQFFPEYHAGTEVLTYETAKELKRRGHDVEVWTGFPADPELAREKPFESYTYEGIPVQRYNHSFDALPPGTSTVEFEHNDKVVGKQFREYLREAKPDLVHFFHLFRLTPTAIEACIAEGVPMCFTPTDFWSICQVSQLRLANNDLCTGPDCYGCNCIRHLVAHSGLVRKLVPNLPDSILRLFIWGAGRAWWPDKRYSPMLRAISKRKDFIMDRVNKIDRVLVPTRFMEEMLTGNGLKRDNVRFVPYGLNLKAFGGNITKVPSEKLRVGFIGTVYEHKGLHVLIDAVKKLGTEAPIEVSVYGKLGDFPDYTARVTKMAEGESRIKFCGTFPNDLIAEIFTHLDVLVVPSIWYENTPLVIYSAHASGTPVIATNLGGMSEVVLHDVNGLLFEKGDAEGLAAQLRRVIEEKGTLERLASKVEPPKSIATYAEELEGFYEEVLSERAV